MAPHPPPQSQPHQQPGVAATASSGLAAVNGRGPFQAHFTPVQLRMLVRDRLIREGIRLSSPPYTSKVGIMNHHKYICGNLATLSRCCQL